jgi:hypothetical protein
MPLASFSRITLGFSEPEQVTQRKSPRLIEGFVCNPLLSVLSIQNANSLRKREGVCC